MSDPNTATAGRLRTASRSRVRALTITAMFSAIAFVLMFLEFSVPLIPSFVQMDISELPALLAAFGLGPVYGVIVCLVKNLIHLLITSTGGAGELCNFLLGACFVFPAGLLYRFVKSRKGAFLGALIGMYQAIRPSVNGLLECLIIFNAPFTLVKGLLVTALCFLVYKPLSPLIHGKV